MARRRVPTMDRLGPSGIFVRGRNHALCLWWFMDPNCQLRGNSDTIIVSFDDVALAPAGWVAQIFE
jgi:hypothetical protein